MAMAVTLPAVATPLAVATLLVAVTLLAAATPLAVATLLAPATLLVAATTTWPALLAYTATPSAARLMFLAFWALTALLVSLIICLMVNIY